MKNLFLSARDAVARSMLVNNMSEYKKIKVAIVSLYSIKNLGARYIHAYLKAHGCYSKLFFFKDINIDNYQPETDADINNLINKVKEDGCNLVGLSVGCSAFADLAKKITIKLKQETSAIVIWGGVHPTVSPEDCIRIADSICIGEGEKPLLELVEKLESGLDYTDIANLWVKKEKHVYKNDIRNLSDSLDDLPWPDYEDEDKYFVNKSRIKKFDPIRQQEWEYVIMASRGCPYKCSYCTNSFYWEMYKNKGSFVRQRSVRSVIGELVYAKETFPNLKKIAFYDDVFGLDMAWNREFASEYKKEIGLPFWCYVYPQSVKNANLTALKDAGLYMVDIGLQSGSERIRREVFKRNGTNNKFREAIQIIHENGLTPLVNVIMDNPYETEMDKKDTFELLLSIRPFKLLMLSLAHFPRTELTRKALSDGLINREDIEDIRKNVFYSWRSKPVAKDDSNENIFWKSLIGFSSKSFIPIRFLKYISRQKWIKQFPRILIPLVYVSNYIKWCGVGVNLLLKGQINFSMMRQWTRYVLKAGT